MLHWLLLFSSPAFAAWNLDDALSHAKKEAGEAAIEDMMASVAILKDGPTTKKKFNFYLYPPKFEQDKYLSYWFANLTAALSKSPRRTMDPASASVFFLGIDTSCERNWPNYLGEAEENYRYGDTGWQTAFIRV
jgi:hypothetical protein